MKVSMSGAQLGRGGQGGMHPFLPGASRGVGGEKGGKGRKLQKELEWHHKRTQRPENQCATKSRTRGAKNGIFEKLALRC